MVDKKSKDEVLYMLVKEMFKYSIMYEESALAHCLFHLLEEKKISLDDE